MKDDTHTTETQPVVEAWCDLSSHSPSLEDVPGEEAEAGSSPNQEFGHHGFDLAVIKLVAERELAREYRLDLFDEVVSETTFSLLQVPEDVDIKNPPGYAAAATRHQIKRTLQAESKRREREERWVDFCRLTRGVAASRLETEVLIDCFLEKLGGELSLRQKEICRLVLDGKRFKEISVILQIDRKTVYNDLRRLHSLFRAFCDNFDPDDEPDPPRSNRRISSSDENGSRSNDSNARSVPGQFILTSPSVAQRIMTSMKRFPSAETSVIKTADCIPEFKRLLLALPAFREVDVGPLADDGIHGKNSAEVEEIVCDSLAEIIEWMNRISRSRV